MSTKSRGLSSLNEVAWSWTHVLPFYCFRRAQVYLWGSLQSDGMREAWSTWHWCGRPGHGTDRSSASGRSQGCSAVVIQAIPRAREGFGIVWSSISFFVLSFYFIWFFFFAFKSCLVGMWLSKETVLLRRKVEELFGKRERNLAAHIHLVGLYKAYLYPGKRSKWIAWEQALLDRSDLSLHSIGYAGSTW